MCSQHQAQGLLGLPCKNYVMWSRRISQNLQLLILVTKQSRWFLCSLLFLQSFECFIFWINYLNSIWFNTLMKNKNQPPKQKKYLNNCNNNKKKKRFFSTLKSFCFSASPPNVTVKNKKQQQKKKKKKKRKEKKSIKCKAAYGHMLANETDSFFSFFTACLNIQLAFFLLKS